jgi:hypothetical protein
MMGVLLGVHHPRRQGAEKNGRVEGSTVGHGAIGRTPI